MPAFKPAYLIHGDDHGRVAERRSRLRGLAEAQSGVQGVELLAGEEATPEAVARTLNAMTFALGRRFIIIDGVERWKDTELDPLQAALEQLPPKITVAFFAREEARRKAPGRLAAAVRAAGGDVASENAVKPWQLPKWVIARAQELQLTLDGDGARALIGHVGERQQRLQRELEKLALGTPPGTELQAAEIERLTAPSAEHRAWSLADALVSGDADAATRTYIALRAQGERLPGLLYLISGRLRLAHELAQAIDAGEPAAQIKRRLRMPSRAAERLIADAGRSGADCLRRAIVQVADLELASRGGGAGGASEDTVALLAIQRIAA
jgi:DNA polymerase-3 subunit delta